MFESTLTEIIYFFKFHNGIYRLCSERLDLIYFVKNYEEKNKKFQETKKI